MRDINPSRIGYGRMRVTEQGARYEGNIPLCQDGEPIFMIPERILPNVISEFAGNFRFKLRMDEELYDIDKAPCDEDGVIEIFPDSVTIDYNGNPELGIERQTVTYYLDRFFHTTDREDIYAKYTTEEKMCNELEKQLLNGE